MKQGLPGDDSALDLHTADGGIKGGTDAPANVATGLQALTIDAAAPDSVDQVEIESVRQLLSKEDNAMCDDAMVARYCRAVRSDARHVARRLHATLAWWRAEQPSKMFCPACPKEPCSHYMHCACFDRSGRPVIYSCMELASNRNIEDNRRQVNLFEEAHLIPEKQMYEQVLNLSPQAHDCHL